MLLFSAAVCDMVGGRSRDRASSSNDCLVPAFEAFCGRVELVAAGQLGPAPQTLILPKAARALHGSNLIGRQSLALQRLDEGLDDERRARRNCSNRWP